MELFFEVLQSLFHIASTPLRWLTQKLQKTLYVRSELLNAKVKRKILNSKFPLIMITPTKIDVLRTNKTFFQM